MRSLCLLAVGLFFTACLSSPVRQTSSPDVYLGFDRNDYPGDAALPVLRKTFSFSGYWLSPPPNAKTNTWAGKRTLLESQGFGFLLLYRGRSSAQLSRAKKAVELGRLDARNAAAAARREGFSEGAVIFLDIEEGGRLAEGQHAYLRSWAQMMKQQGFRPGVYCSGIAADEGEGSTITTADDIRRNDASSEFVFWVYNDVCPPSPGCASPQNPPPPSASGTSYATVWQFVRSPRDKQTARKCTGYAANGNCYIALDTARQWHLDLNVALTSDPSQTR